MELINNITKTLKDDLSVEIKKGSTLSIAEAFFSIYAFQELKKQLTSIEELRFIFTSPTFVSEKTKKEKREFYIPCLNRKRSLYGTEFEIKLRNETIKHFNEMADDNDLIAELLQEDVNTLVKYDIRGEINGQA